MCHVGSRTLEHVDAHQTYGRVFYMNRVGVTGASRFSGWMDNDNTRKKNPTGGNGIFDEGRFSTRRHTAERTFCPVSPWNERLLSKRSNHALPKRVRRNRVTRLRLESSIPSRIIVFSSSSRRRRLREQRFEQLHAEECVREAGRHHHRRVLGLGALDHQGVGR